MKFTKEDTNMIKGAAVLMLLYYHLFYYEPMFSAFPVNFAPFTLGRVMYGSRIWNICVSIFLFLSVFGMYRSLETLEQSSGKELNGKQCFWYVCKRYFSLMLGFIAVYLTMLLFFGWDISGLDVYGTGPHAAYNVFMDVTGLSQFFDTPCINSSWWYLELAIEIIVLMPLFYKGMKKFEYLMIPVVFVFPFLFTVDMTTAKFRMTVLFALCCARYHWLEKWKELQWKNNLFLSEMIKFFVMVLVAGLSVYFRQMEGDAVSDSFRYICEGVLAFALVAIFYEYAGYISGFKQMLCLLGRHSMNIYFAHLFFSYYMIKVRSFIFSFHYFLLIYLVLLLMVLAYSIALEQLKKWTGYNRINENLRTYCDRKIRGKNGF